MPLLHTHTLLFAVVDKPAMCTCWSHVFILQEKVGGGGGEKTNLCKCCTKTLLFAVNNPQM